jgi:hypothetical protein
MTPVEIVQDVFARLHAEDRSALDHYAADAVRIAPNGRQDGRDAILAFYETYWESGGLPMLEKVIYAQPPLVCAVLLPVGMIDVFEIEDGLIRAITVCAQLPEA